MKTNDMRFTYNHVTTSSTREVFKNYLIGKPSLVTVLNEDTDTWFCYVEDIEDFTERHPAVAASCSLRHMFNVSEDTFTIFGLPAGPYLVHLYNEAGVADENHMKGLIK